MKNDVATKSANFESLLLFATNISVLFLLNQSKSRKIFPDKPSANIFSGFNTMLV